MTERPEATGHGSSPGRRYRVGVDIGGTFTDVVAIERTTGEMHLAKVPTVPADPSVGFINGLVTLMRRFAIAPAEIEFLSHGATVATNTIIEGKGAQAGLIASAGFSDVLEIAYQTRPALFDLFRDRPKPLIPRYRTIGVPERIGPDGNVLIPLDESAVRAAATRLRKAGAEIVVIAFLHSYRFQAHERRAREIIAEAHPDLPVVLSSDVCAEYREYPRTSTAVVNAVLLPRVGPYLTSLQERLRGERVNCELHLMTSAGGILGCDVARRQPVQLVESGPAAGVIGATFVAGIAGFRNLLAFDMGGTTAKAALIVDGEPRISDQFEVGAMAVAQSAAARGHGYPVRTPVLEIVEIGAGGGSVGHLDPGGALAVGPESMGADPGPACYARGGDRPTITDANLVLGRINADYFLGGESRLDAGLAHRALEARLARPLGRSVTDVANAMIEIANAKMTGALHLCSVQRGLDPREYVLVTSGGAGPLHAAAVARELGVRTVLVPPSPGLNSALGLLATDLKHDFTRTLMIRTRDADWGEVNAAFAAMRDRALALLREEGVADADMQLTRQADMCYLGQSFELRVPVPEGLLSAAHVPGLEAGFHAMHRAAYSFAAETDATQIVNLRLTAVGRVARPTLRAVPPGGPSAQGALKLRRPVYFHEAGQFVDCPVFERARLQAGNRFDGPAIVEQMDSTTLVPPGTSVEVDASGNLIMTIAA